MSDPGVAATPDQPTTTSPPPTKARKPSDYLKAVSPDQQIASSTKESLMDFAATDKANREIAAKAQALEPPKYQSLNALPHEEHIPEKDPLRAMLNPVFIAAFAIATLATKGHLQGAAQAITGYVNGVKARNKEQQDAARQSWLDQMELAKAQNDLVVQANADAFRQYTGNVQALTNQMTINSQLLQDRQTGRALALGNLKLASEINEQRMRASLELAQLKRTVQYKSLEQWESQALSDMEKDFQKKNHRTWTGEEEAAAVQNVKTGGAPQLSAEAQDLAATNFLKTGSMGAWGMGGMPQRIQIINKASEKARRLGLNSDQVIAGQQEFKSEGHALSVVSSRLAVAQPSEQAAILAQKQAERLMNKGAGTPYGPVVNRWLQAGRQATSDPDVAAFNTAMDTYTMEAAKVMTGSTGSAGSSDAARREAAELASKYGSPDQIRSQFTVINNDMHYKIQSWQNIQRGLVEGMSEPVGPNTPTDQTGGQDGFQIEELPGQP